MAEDSRILEAQASLTRAFALYRQIHDADEDNLGFATFTETDGRISVDAKFFSSDDPQLSDFVYELTKMVLIHLMNIENRDLRKVKLLMEKNYNRAISDVLTEDLR